MDHNGRAQQVRWRIDTSLWGMVAEIKALTPLLPRPHQKVGLEALLPPPRQILDVSFWEAPWCRESG